MLIESCQRYPRTTTSFDTQTMSIFLEQSNVCPQGQAGRRLLLRPAAGGLLEAGVPHPVPQLPGRLPAQRELPLQGEGAQRARRQTRPHRRPAGQLPLQGARRQVRQQRQGVEVSETLHMAAGCHAEA